MSDKENKVLDPKKFQETIAAAAVANASGDTLRVPSSDTYYGAMADAGIPKAQVVAVQESMATVTESAVNLATDTLAEKIKAARAAGDDPSELVQGVNVKLGGGHSVSVRVSAERQNRNPQTGEKMTTYGGVSARIDIGAAIRSAPAARARDIIKSAMGAK